MLTTYLVLGLIACSLGYLGFAVWCVMRFHNRATPARHDAPSVSVLKPICGLDAELHENLRSFCAQDYPVFEIVFGVADPLDPALPVLRRLQAEFPLRDIKIVVDPRISGANAKVSNLANIYRSTSHDILVIADSDMRVGPDYLATVVDSLMVPGVGAATCLYKAVARRGIASKLGADFVNDWFLPSVLVAQRFEPLRYCFGATMALRREVLEEIGGFNCLRDVLADDYVLGKRVADRGYRVALVPYLVANIVEEPTIGGLFTHELRWARTVRTVRPVGYALSLVTHTLPMSLLAFAVLPWHKIAVLLVATAIVGRVVMHMASREAFKLDAELWYWRAPLRDVLSFVVWASSFCGRDVHWRERHFVVDSNGKLEPRESSVI
jgi:ceramide glucosyltransferase